MKAKLTWTARNTPAELRVALRTLAEGYPLAEGASGGISLEFTATGNPGVCEVMRRGNTATITYGGAAQAVRGVGAVLSGIPAPGRRLRESTPFSTLGIMLDCSRNAVMTVRHVQVWLRRLALLGYNQVMLYCDHDSAFAGMAYCAEKAYGAKQPRGDSLQKRFAAICGGDYQAHIRAADLHGGAVAGFHPNMWDDPLFDTRWRTFNRDNPKAMARNAAAYDRLARELARYARDRAAGDLKYAALTARAFADRYALSAALLSAYRRRDAVALERAAAGIARTRRSIRAMAAAFRVMWLGHNKREGLDVIQGRFGMLDARYAEMARCVQEYLNGTIASIAEWDCRCPAQ